MLSNKNMLQLSKQLQEQQALNALLQNTLAEKDRIIKIKEATVTLLREQLNVLLHKRYGASREVSVNQLQLFDEAETIDASTDAIPTDADDERTVITSHTRQKTGRKALSADLPRIEVIHDLAAHEKNCPHDGTALTLIGAEISEQLDIIPATIQVIKHIRKKYACPHCEQHIQTAPLPPQMIPKSLASAGTLAWVCVSKYGDGLPLYRQETILSRLGLNLSRASLANWMIHSGLGIPSLINLFRDHLLEQSYIHMDETPVQVLNEAGKSAQSTSYMWVQAAGPPDQSVILFDYDPSRSSTVPQRLLQDYRGALMVDGYEGYNAACEQLSLTRLGCWAHARRKFIEAQRASKKGIATKADYALKLIGKLYQLEKTLKETTAEQRYQQRQQQAKPILEKLKAWLIDTLPCVPPKTALGNALHYLNKQWPRLTGYLDNGNYPIDNNRVENAIRPFAIGRKNWLFSNSQAGINASANLYSLIETAKANHLEPYEYLKHIFTELPKAKTVEEIEKLLPWNYRNHIA